MKLEYKTFSYKVNEAKEGVINGYASTFGNIDQGQDVVEKGAFKKTIKENPNVLILIDHDYRQIAGWNKTAAEDDTGLAVEGLINMDVQMARERFMLAKQAMEMGTNMGLSIGYSTIKAEPDKKNPGVRILKELKLYEYSLVGFPMNVEAMITDAKSLGTLDKTQFILKTLFEQGITVKDVELALRKEAAAADYDPVKVSQSLDRLLENFRS